MTDSRQFKRGFTLIELLVVIAIIGILSAVVLASLQRAHTKGNDAAIESDLTTIRTQAQMYYNDHTSSYGSNTGFESNCAAADDLFSDGTVNEAVQGIRTRVGAGGTILCNVAGGGQAYAAFANLTTDAGNWWCVDSTGASREEASSTNPATLTACP